MHKMCRKWKCEYICSLMWMNCIDSVNLSEIVVFFFLSLSIWFFFLFVHFQFSIWINKKCIFRRENGSKRRMHTAVQRKLNKYSKNTKKKNNKFILSYEQHGLGHGIPFVRGFFFHFNLRIFFLLTTLTLTKTEGRIDGLLMRSCSCTGKMSNSRKKKNMNWIRFGPVNWISQ